MVTLPMRRLRHASFALAVSACAPAPPAATPSGPLTAAYPAAADTLTSRTSTVLRRWIDEVWHQGHLDLVDVLVAPTYTRHEDDSTYTVTRAEYAAQIRALRARFPQLRYEVHDSAAVGDRFWIRYTFRGGPDSTGPWPTRPGLQLYRLEDGRLAETWMLLRPGGTEWDDAEEPAPSSRLTVVDSVTHRTAPAREPMVVRHPSGDLFLAGFGRPEHGGPAVDPLVPRLWRSDDGGSTWEAVDVGGVEDGAVGNSDVDLAVGPDGTLYFVTLRFDPERREGVSVALGVSGDAGDTWRWRFLDRTPFTDRPWVAVAPDGTAHVVWNDGAGVVHTASRDRGGTWSDPRRIHDAGGSSHLAVGPAGEVAVRIGPRSAAGNRYDPDADLVAISTDGGRSWAKRPPPATPEWGRTFEYDGPVRRWVEPLAWDETGALYALWSEGRDVRLARSTDRGGTWRAWTIATGGDLFLYPYLVARGDGELAATWMSMTADWRFVGHVARVRVGAGDGGAGAGPVVSTAGPFPLRSWGYGDDGNLWSDPAGEYFPALLLPDAGVGIALPVREPAEGRVGFEWRVYR